MSRYGGWIIAMAVAVIALAVGFFAGWFSPADTPVNGDTSAYVLELSA